MEYTKEEIEKRYENLKDVVANQRLEGYELDLETKEDLEKIVLGQMTMEESLKKLKDKIASGEFYGSGK